MNDEAVQSTTRVRVQSLVVEDPARRRIPLMQPVLDTEMLEAALLALQNEKFVLGESVHKFEEEFARFCGARYAVSTGSGTAALQIALQAIGVGRGDSVLTTPFSFFATANAAVHAEAEVEFADVGSDGFNISPTDVRKRLSISAKAIVPVHLYGHPCRMDQLSDLAEEKGIPLVEDACQAHGSEYKSKRVGSIGEAGCFSFYPSKNMTVAGDGGMIVTSNEDVAEAAKCLRDCGRETKYTMARVGYTSRLNTVNAAIGRVQLRHLDRWNEKRREIASLYREQLSTIPELVLPPDDNDGLSVYHLFVIRSGQRDRVANWLLKHGVETGIHYPVPIHLQPPYRRTGNYSEGSFPRSEQLAKEVLSLPMYPGLIVDDVTYISSLVREALSVS